MNKNSLVFIICLICQTYWSRDVMAFTAEDEQHAPSSSQARGKGDYYDEDMDDFDAFRLSDANHDDVTEPDDADGGGGNTWDDIMGDANYGQFGIDTSDILGQFDPVSDKFLHVGGDHPALGTGGLDLMGQDASLAGTGHSPNDFFSTYFSGPSFEPAINHGLMDSGTSGIVCPQKCLCRGTEVDCAGQNLTSVPQGISPLTTWLDLSMNNLERLPDDTFTELTNLKDLRCVGNNLTRLPKKLFKNNKYLQILNFQGNLFSKVPPRAFQNLRYLIELHLDANMIETIPRRAFAGLTSLKQLWLDANKLDHVPATALRELTSIQALALTMNQIQELPDFAFQNNTNLIQLSLADNQIENIADQAFYALSKLKFLQLNRNRISAMPSAFSHLISLNELNLENNLLTHLPDKTFLMKDKLQTLMLQNNPITSVGDAAFTNLPSLKELKLSEVHDMSNFPDLTGTQNLTIVQLDRANIRSLPQQLCANLKKLKTFDVHSNKIGTIPEMSQCKYLTILNMANNELTSLEGRLFNGMDHLKDLTLSINYIHTITEDAFVGLSALEYLNLAENHIRDIHPNAFLPLKSLKDLNLGDNRLHHLPTAGLVSLEKLKVFYNPDLKEFPAKEKFKNVNNFVLSYAYHCCDFINSRPQQMHLDIFREKVMWMGAEEDGRMAMWERYQNDSRIWESIVDNTSIENDIWEEFARNNYDYEASEYPLGPEAPTYLEDYRSHSSDRHYFIAKAAISCKPKPGPFMPCDDLFGWWSLRCGVWFVFMLALLGNGVVFFVSVTSKSKMDVPRFLICNLAMADFFMGVYLGILAIMDASTLGQFKKFAIQWQMSAGCLLAGTLGVLSSELSVYTLTVITLERFYAITHAMQLNKRLSLKHAGLIMLCGWIWSFGLAILPLFGISDYRKFAICLPFEIEDMVSKSYVCFIMVFNGISFCIILSCYLIMYISIRDSQAWNSNDTRVAKRMALLVFTDFLCWAPIAFLSLAAAFGKNLIHLNEAKVLTIFILPLNSCANPFLYAFFTKQFKRDCVLLCRRLEDSSIARHFSQVSQRHVSMSWKLQRRPSALHSLMGEGKSHHSNNLSTGSNSYGLVNYNSEISSGTNKDAGKEAKCLTHVQTKHVHKGKKTKTADTQIDRHTHKQTHLYTHKYKPCPGDVSDEEAAQVKSRGGPSRRVDARHGDRPDVILHQDYSSPSGGTSTYAWTTETYLPEEEEGAGQMTTGTQPTPSPDKKCEYDYKLGESHSGMKGGGQGEMRKKEEKKEEEDVWKKRTSPKMTDVDSSVVTGRCDRVSHGHDTCGNLQRNADKCSRSKKKNAQDDVAAEVDADIGKNDHETDTMLLRKCSANECQYSVSDSNQNDKMGTSSRHEKDGSNQLQKKKQERFRATRHVVDDISGKHNRHQWNLQCCSANSSPVELTPDHLACGLKLTSSDDSVPGSKGCSAHVHKKSKLHDDNGITGTGRKFDQKASARGHRHHQLSTSPIVCTPRDCELGVDDLHRHQRLTPCRVKSAPPSPCPDHSIKLDHSAKVNQQKVIAVRHPEHKARQSKHSRKHHHRHIHGSGTDTKPVFVGVTGESQPGKKHPPASPGDQMLNHDLLRRHAGVDKSVHLQYFQQSIAGRDFVCKSNSLVELTQAQIQEARLPQPSSDKRRSLTPRQEGYMLLRGEAGGCTLRGYHHQYSRHYSDYQLFPGVKGDNYDYGDEFPPLLSLEKYFEGETSPVFDNTLDPRVESCDSAPMANLRTRSRDWEAVGQEEITTLLDDSDEEKNRDSMSSAKTSADKESGFHSQV